MRPDDLTIRLVSVTAEQVRGKRIFLDSCILISIIDHHYREVVRAANAPKHKIRRNVDRHHVDRLIYTSLTSLRRKGIRFYATPRVMSETFRVLRNRKARNVLGQVCSDAGGWSGTPEKILANRWPAEWRLVREDSYASFRSMQAMLDKTINLKIATAEWTPADRSEFEMFAVNYIARSDLDMMDGWHLLDWVMCRGDWWMTSDADFTGIDGLPLILP